MCTSIPQDPKLTNNCISAIAQETTSATTYPVHITKDILWAYLPLFNASISFPSLPEHLQPEYLRTSTTTTFIRDMPYSFDMALENVFDASHIPFAHHRVFSSRQDAAQTTGYSISSLTDKQKCVVGHTNVLHGKPRKDMVTFIPPVHYFFQDNHTRDGSYETKLMISAVPISPGRTRLFLTAPYKPFWRNLLPKWMAHAAFNRFLESDIWVHDIENFIRKPHNVFALVRNNTSIKPKDDSILGERSQTEPRYGVVTSADRGILHWRRWWKRNLASVSPIFAAAHEADLQSLTPYARRERMLDHIRYCKHCQQALSRVKKYKSTASILGYSSLTWMVSILAMFMRKPLHRLRSFVMHLIVSSILLSASVFIFKVTAKIEKDITGKTILESLSVSRLP